MGLEDFLLEQARNQLKPTSRAITDSVWFDTLITKLTTSLDGADPTVKIGSMLALKAITDNKSKIVGLGANAFTLLIQQLAAGRQQDAVNTYIQANGSIDDLIADIDAGTWGLIQAKKRLDQWHKDALDVISSIAIKGAQYLLPLLLTLV